MADESSPQGSSLKVALSSVEANDASATTEVAQKLLVAVTDHVHVMAKAALVAVSEV